MKPKRRKPRVRRRGILIRTVEMSSRQIGRLAGLQTVPVLQGRNHRGVALYINVSWDGR